MDSRFNIPAPLKFNPEYAEMERSKVLIVLVPQGDVEATAEADSSTEQPRKSPAHNKAPVP